MNTTSAARPTEQTNGHWYAQDGTPVYTVIAKGTGQPRKTTLADAKKMQLLPSVTNILDSVLRKPALETWKVEQGVLAVLTTPRLTGEGDDAFVHRVLQVERVQDQEAKTARDIGTDIHLALENYFLGLPVDENMRPWIEPAAKEICSRGQLVTAEKILVGDGYAGKTDLIQEATDAWLIYDWKSTKKLPDPKKGAWIEHRLQAAAYAAAFHGALTPTGNQKPIRTCNVYVSTTEQGNFCVCEHDPDWQKTYNQGFAPLVTVWKFLNSYAPKQNG